MRSGAGKINIDIQTESYDKISTYADGDAQ